MNFLNADNRFTRILSRITDLVYLQLLFLLTSLPIVTVGAGLAAMYSVCRRLRQDTISGVASCYFREFAANWKRSTAAWLMVLLIAVTLYVDVNYYSGTGASDTAARTLAYVLAVLAYLEFLYLFPMLAWLDLKLLPQMKNAFLLSLAHFATTLTVTVVFAAAILLSRVLLPLFLFIGFSGPVYLASGSFLKALSAQAPELTAQAPPPGSDE